MKIIHFYSENVKRIKVVDITPTQDVVIIAGKNEAGKSSVINSIWLALQYRAAKKQIPNPLRVGSKQGKTVLDLGNYIVTRTYNASGSSQLKVETPEGMQIKSPQALLDGLISDLSFDPWSFTRKEEKEQRQILSDLMFKLSGGKIDLSEFDRKISELFELRKDINRNLSNLRASISHIRPPKNDDPREEQSIQELTSQLDNAIECFNLQKEINRHEEEIKKLKNKIAILEAQGSLDIDNIKDNIQKIESHNTRAREVKQYNALQKEINNTHKNSKDLSRQIELTRIEKEEALENCSLPLKNLEITENGIFVKTNGGLIPFKQASSAQKLKLSLAIAMAANPNIRVIRISDGSLLDEDSFNIIKEMAKTKDYQVWIEKVSNKDSGKGEVYLEDGMIK